MQKLLPPHLAMLCIVVMLASTLLDQQYSSAGVILKMAGGITAAFGFFLAVAAKRQFRQVSANVNTFESPTALITTGWFRFGRNPMYLGILLLLVGIALLLNNPWAIIGPVVFFGAASWWYIPYEEKAALTAFGEPYRDYCEAVRRWV